MEDGDYSDDALNTSADIFANSSTDTVTENFPPPPMVDGINEKLILSPRSDSLLDEFISDNNNPQRMCCPFCIFDFGFEYILKEHIKASHPMEIKQILSSGPGDSDFYECPFCEAKFYHKDLLPKHVLRKHQLCIVSMFSGFSPEKYVYCRFCPHKILRKHYKLLLIHIERKHLQVFENYFLQKYSKISKSLDSLNVIDAEDFGSEYTSPGLSNQMNKLTTIENITDSPTIKSILKPHTAYPIEAAETIDDIMFTTDVSVHYANFEVKPTRNARRKLRFNLPSPEEDHNKENMDVTPTKRKKTEHSSKWLKIFHSKKKNDVDSVDAKQLSHFRCGICSEGFKKNSKLAEHVKKKHKGITLQAQYCCGDCDAKFYRNSFLRRHCKFHHSPLCLKSTFVKDQGKF